MTSPRTSAYLWWDRDLALECDARKRRRGAVLYQYNDYSRLRPVLKLMRL
jgi:hypothetical protein